MEPIRAQGQILEKKRERAIGAEVGPMRGETLEALTVTDEFVIEPQRGFHQLLQLLGSVLRREEREFT